MYDLKQTDTAGKAQDVVIGRLKGLIDICMEQPQLARLIALGILNTTSSLGHSKQGRAATTLPSGSFVKDPFAAIPKAEQVDISIVLPIYNEAENIPELYRRLCQTLAQVGLPRSVEIIFVDDGSRDESAGLIKALREDDARITLLRFSRNFGHQAAITAGIDYSRGNAVILMDADLQDPPELLLQMLEQWNNGAEVVYAVRHKRKEIIFKRAAYHLFYRVLQMVSNVEIPLDSGDFCLMDRRVVLQLRALPEKNRFLRGLRSWVGFRQVALHYEREARFAGEPKYTFRKLLRLALDGVLSFSSLPLRLATYIGLLTCTAGVLYLVYILAHHFLGWYAPQGWTSLIALVLLIGGVQLVLLGAIGEYIARIYDETKQRPNYIVREFLQ